MRIAQIAPLHESVPPRAYGGTERVVSYLTEELVRMGHDVTLFASADSRTRARLVPCVKRSLRTDPECVDVVTPHLLMMEEVARRAADFDILHYHLDAVHLPYARRSDTPGVTTLHGALDHPDWVRLFEEFREIPLVSISDAQRAPVPAAGWRATVYHGLPEDLFLPGAGRGGYLAFVGRISPQKRADRAIAIARAVGLPLRIGAKVDRADEEYFAREIRPLLREPGVQFLGEIDDAEKSELLRNAQALLFPIDWREPFGLVVIEALACGTPVVAWRHGSVPELVEDGVTGFVVDSMPAAIRAARATKRLDRRACRATFERRFSAGRMARDYLDVYRAVLREGLASVA